MKELTKDEMKQVIGGLSDVLSDDDVPGCKGNTCNSTQECRDINAGSCWPCSDGTHHCG